MQNLSTVLNERAKRYTSEPFTWTSFFVIQALLSQSQLVQPGEWDRGAWRGSSLVAAYVGVWWCVPFLSLSKVFSSWILPSLFFFSPTVYALSLHTQSSVRNLCGKKEKIFLDRERCWNSEFATGKLSCSPLPSWPPHHPAEWLLLFLVRALLGIAGLQSPGF